MPNNKDDEDAFDLAHKSGCVIYLLIIVAGIFLLQPL